MSGALEGMKVLLTRDQGLADDLRLRGAEVEVVEVMRYEPVPVDEAAAGFDWIVFTSRRAVTSWPCPLAGGPRIACVGPETAKAVEERGGTVDYVPRRHDSRSLAEGLLAERSAAGSRVLFPCAEKALDTVPRVLAEGGAEVVRRVVYRGVPVDEVPAGAGVGADAALFLSPSAVDAFAEAGGDLRAAPALAIGETTADALRRHGVEARVAPTADREGLITALEEMARSQ